MTRAEKKAYNTLVKEMIEEGVDKEMAKTLARVQIEYGIVKPVIQDGEIENFKF